VVWEVKALPREAIRAIFAAAGGLKGLTAQEPGRLSVLVKPNLCLPHPAKQATTSSVEMIEAVCRELAAGGVKKITVGDHTLKKAADFEKAEFMSIPERIPEVKILLANEQRLYEPVQVPGKALKQTEILKIARRSDLVINLATAKHGAATHVSLATKNLMGLIWDRAIFHTGLDLDQAIGDLPLAIRPHLNIIDASRVLLTGGPTGPGKTIEDGRVFAGLDMVAVDAAVASRYSFGEKMVAAASIGHLLAAHRNGLGEIEPGRISVVKLESPGQ
jgi:uncharacterized protein (DUF362 family)